MDYKINATLLLEILGRPKEHVMEALTTLVLKLGSEAGVKITNKVIHEPQPVKDSQTLFTSFAEVDVELDSLQSYVMTLFTYMPSHVEIISPERIAISNTEMNEIGNAITQRLHHYDAVTKNTIVERNTLLQKLKEIAPHLFQQQQKNLPQSFAKKQIKKKPSKKKSKNKKS
ncbi:hypothetical protein J4402_01005 [Candidatus Pacearchaeota archaeon]|nr:hypothetical protein [Candidatus Pacearchaeota archaeon]